RQNYQVPDWMYREAVTLQKAISNPVSSLIGSLNGISRAAFTSASPPFVVANMLNDSLTAFLSRGILPTETVSRLLKSLRGLEGDKVMQSFRLAGGYQMRFYGKDLAKDVIKSGGQIIKGNEGIGKKLLKLIPEAGEAGEQAPRMALFERQLNKTLPGWKQMTAEQIATTPQGRKAAADAVELTINFGRGGYLIKAANPFVIFLNANMEGMKLPFRVLRDNPAAHWRLAGVGAGIAGLTAYNLSHPEYFDIPNHIRWGSVVVMLPSKEKDSSGKPKPNYLTIIPRTREWGAFLGSETYAMEKMFSDNPTDFGKFSATMAPMLFPLAEIPMPAVLEELAGQAANWDFYRSQPIVPEEMQGLPSEQQVQPWVSPTMAAIANATGQSPLRAQHFMQGIFGGAGQTFTSIADYIASMVAPQQVDQRISNLAEQYKSLTGTIERNKFLMNLSQKDKDAIFAEMRKPQRGVPVVSPILRRVIPGQGGQLYRTGQELAEKETGLKPEQTRKVSGVLQNISNIYLERQKQIDKSFNGGQITGKQWRDSRAELGQRYQGALDSLGVQFPSAAQVQKDSSLADRYYQTIATLANTMPDSRERAAMLTAGWYAIDLQEIEPGEKDWNTFTRMRDGYKASLSASDKQLLDDYLQSKMTDVEKLYSQAQEVLKPYWEVPDKVWGSYPPELRQVADAIEKLEKTNPDMAKKILQQYPNILYVRKLIATVKKRYKEAMPAVQGALNIFYKY
ncbi:MAG: hypothetical protein KJ556_20905, partial [Gammaproteobacteria bacterium]|nr:hypothetical protein [Gammaproteobacteria bacterium]